MSSSTSSSSPRPARARAAAGALLLAVMAIELAVAIAFRGSEDNWIRRRAEGLSPAPGQVLVLGDSTTIAGIDPVRLARGLGRPVALGWYPGSQSFVGVRRLLRRRLEAAPPPALLVLMFSPYSLRGELHAPSYARRFAGFGELVELRRSGVVGTEAALEILLTSLLPSLRYRSSVSNYLHRKLRLPPRFGERRPPPSARRRRRAAPRPKGPHPDFRRNVRLARAYVGANRFSPPPHASFFLQGTLEEAHAAQVPALLVPGPLYEGVFVSGREQAFFRDGASYFGALAAGYPNARLLLPEPELFRAEEMGNNHVHLNAGGRERFTRLLAAKICATQPPALVGGCTSRAPEDPADELQPKKRRKRRRRP